MGNPTAVDFDIIYTDLLPFPRITFCNYNLIKLTTVSSEQASIVLTFFRLSSSPDSDLIHQLEAIDKNGTMNLTEAFRQGHHQIEDALITCDFRGIRCGISNFTLIVTDYGWCYQFVGDGGTLYVTDAGMRHGLSLTLNAEQYEYVGGPRLGVGYLMSIHSPEDTPLIEEKGIAVPVGGETLINLDTTEVSLIPPPNGDCSNKHMKSDNKYSVSTCHRECMSDYIVATCGCEDFVTDNSVVCNFTQYYACFNPIKRNFSQSLAKGRCECPPACFSRVYNPTMSFTPLSHRAAKERALLLSSNPRFMFKYKESITKADLANPYHATLLNSDVDALRKLAPYLAQFIEVFLPLQPILGRLRTLTTSFSSQINPSAINSSDRIYELNESISESLQALEQNTELMLAIASFTKNQLLSPEQSLKTDGRTVTFASFCQYAESSTLATIANWLYYNLEALQANIETNISAMILDFSSSLRLRGSRLLQAVASLSQNATEINMLFNGVISRIMSPLSQLVQVGLPDINRYMTESNVRTFSIDEDFIRDNVVNVNIFLGEMSRQTKNKKMTDSYTSLICDLGGTFGLFLGASLMTLYEFVDIVVYALGHRCSTRAKGASSADNGSS